MSKKLKYRHFTVNTTEGGALVAGTSSGDSAGANNYVEKINFRRETDGEVRREGWEQFRLNTLVSELSDINHPVRMLHQFHSDEQEVLVAAAGDKIFRLDESSEQWVCIAQGLQNIDNINIASPSPCIRWEAVAIDGYIIFNNGADLPLIYRNGWPQAHPIYALRERGILRCGTISEFDGRLWLADITYIDEEGNPSAFALWMAQDSPYKMYTTSPIVSSYNSPHTIEYSAWRLATNIGVAKASPYLFGQVYEGSVEIDEGNILQKITLPFELGGVSQVHPYSPEYITSQTEEERIIYLQRANPGDSTPVSVGCTIQIGDDIRMTVGSGVRYVYDASVAGISIVDGKTEITLAAPSNVSDQTGVSTADGLQATGSSTGAPENGDPVVFILKKEPDAFSSVAATAKEAADALSFPEDGSRILKMAKLSDKLIVYRQTGYLAISRGNTQSAFFFEEKYRGERVADFRNTIISINEQRQMFVGHNGVFFITPASVEPMPFEAYMLGPQFWRNITKDEKEHCYAVENNLTHEVFIISPIGVIEETTNSSNSAGAKKLDWGVMAYDMMHGTLSQIDSTFTAACNIFPTDKIPSRWFLLATHLVENAQYVDSEEFKAEFAEYTTPGAKIMRYAYGPAIETEYGRTDTYRVFMRDGTDYVSRLKYGKTDFSDKFSEKQLRSYVLHLSDVFDYDSYFPSDYVNNEYTQDLQADVKIVTFTTAATTEEEQINETLSSLDTETMIPLFAQGNYYQDTIEMKGRDNGFKIIGRTFEVSGVRTRHTNQAQDA